MEGSLPIESITGLIESLAAVQSCFTYTASLLAVAPLVLEPVGEVVTVLIVGTGVSVGVGVAFELPLLLHAANAMGMMRNGIAAREMARRWIREIGMVTLPLGIRAGRPAFHAAMPTLRLELLIEERA
jgi:hypothetical protein